MAIDSAKALWAKLVSDPELKKEFAKVTGKKEFEDLVAKYGYNCTLEDFQAAKNTPVDNEDVSIEALGQVSGGLSMVGVDYAFTAIEIS